jgi:DNA-directed RNA polymerase subunit alpha
MIVEDIEKIHPAEHGEGYPDEGLDEIQASSDSESDASSEEQDMLLARPVRELELSIRSENCLLRGGIHTIGDLLSKSRDDLLKIRNLGKISLREIEEKIFKLGLQLRSDKVEENLMKEE